MANRRVRTTTSRNFAPLSPLSKLALWVAIVVVVAVAIQGIAWLLGLPFNILQESGGGRGVLLAVALGSLLMLMAADGRPAADYGLAVSGAWQRHFFGGFAVGGLAYFAYCGLVLIPLAYTLETDSLTASRLLKASLSALAAFPVALTQQIIFSGYLLSILRDRHSRVTAVVVPALLFAVLRRMDNPAALGSAESYPLLVGLFLIASLLGILRFQTGSILFPAGFLSGCIFLRRWLRKTSLLAATGPPWLVEWTAPNGDPLQSPVMWCFLAVGIVACSLGVRRKKADTAVVAAPVDAGFKRVFPFSNSAMLAPLDLWLTRLVDARFRVGAKYIPRLMAILFFSSLSTILSLPERLLAPLMLRGRRVPDPLFIVGVHRSGTTHLHNLLSLDPQFSAPRTYQTINPAGFFFFSWLVAPLLAAFLPWRRPMDSVRFHIFSPQEEEFAMAGVSRLSPHWGMTFPRRGAAYDRYMFPERFSSRELRTWKRHLLLFLRKLTFWSGKRPLLKNPYNTARVALLREMFPGAQFIHMVRHPYDVYRSNMHLAREGHVVNQLQDPDERDSYQTRFLDNYRAMEDAFYGETAGLPRDRVVEVRFEDLDRDPIGQVRRVYAQLGLELGPDFDERLRRYLESIAGYQKNRFTSLPEAERRQIQSELGAFMRRWGYGPEGDVRPGDACKAA